MLNQRLSRRTLLRAAGVSIALPLLDAMLPVGLRAEEKAAALSPKRVLLIGRPLGFHAPYFFPEKPGKDYEPTRYLKPLAPYKDRFTVFSGMSHRNYPGGHGTTVALFTGVAPEGVRFNDIRNTISLDQKIAAKLGGETRFPYLVLGNSNDMSWNYKGVRVPHEERATEVFKQLFVQGTPAETAQAVQKIANGKSILDGVRDQAQSLARQLGSLDKQRLDLLLSSVREAEARLAQDEAWVNKPKPKVETKPYTDDYITGERMLERTAQWFDLAQLALQTDSTRVVNLFLWSHERVTLAGVNMAHHDASHHGQDEAKIEQLAKIEEAECSLFADLLGKLQGVKENSATLLDRTQVVYASNLGNASAHTSDNLPVLIAGGGFKHAGHVAFDKKDNYPLSNVYLRMLQDLGFETDRFGSSTGALSEI